MAPQNCATIQCTSDLSIRDPDSSSDRRAQPCLVHLGEGHVLDGLKQPALVADQQHGSVRRVDDRLGAVEVCGCAHGVYSWVCGAIRPKRPELKSSNASAICASLFIPKGP